MCDHVCSLFFFFQAEDGIRDLTVTGVQTCALPIFLGIRLCERCSHLESLTQKGIIAGLVHRGGLRATILTEGDIHVGDAIVPRGLPSKTGKASAGATTEDH